MLYGFCTSDGRFRPLFGVKRRRNLQGRKLAIHKFPIFQRDLWWARQGLNLRPHPCEAGSVRSGWLRTETSKRCSANHARDAAGMWGDMWVGLGQKIEKHRYYNGINCTCRCHPLRQTPLRMVSDIWCLVQGRRTGGFALAHRQALRRMRQLAHRFNQPATTGGCRPGFA